MKNRQWLLARRPDGAIKDSDFNFVETDAPAPGEGQVLVRNIMLSCDPTQRGWIAFDTYLSIVNERAKFGHNAVHRLSPILIASYHPSQQNTSTGKLTAKMLREVFEQARKLS